MDVRIERSPLKIIHNGQELIANCEFTMENEEEDNALAEALRQQAIL